MAETMLDVRRFLETARRGQNPADPQVWFLWMERAVKRLEATEADLDRERTGRLQAEGALARVTADRDEAWARLDEERIGWAERAEKAEAENARLRAALEAALPEADKLRCRKLSQGEAVLGGDWDCCDWREWHATAEAALRGEEVPSGS